MTLDEFFAGREAARVLFEALHAEVERLGGIEVRGWLAEAWAIAEGAR